MISGNYTEKCTQIYSMDQVNLRLILTIIWDLSKLKYSKEIK